MQNHGQKYIQMDQQQRQPRMVELESTLNILRVKKNIVMQQGNIAQTTKLKLWL